MSIKVIVSSFVLLKTAFCMDFISNDGDTKEIVQQEHVIQKEIFTQMTNNTQVFDIKSAVELTMRQLKEELSIKEREVKEKKEELSNKERELKELDDKIEQQAQQLAARSKKKEEQKQQLEQSGKSPKGKKKDGEEKQATNSSAASGKDTDVSKTTSEESNDEDEDDDEELDATREPDADLGASSSVSQLEEEDELLDPTQISEDTSSSSGTTEPLVCVIDFDEENYVLGTDTKYKVAARINSLAVVMSVYNPVVKRAGIRNYNNDQSPSQHDYSTINTFMEAVRGTTAASSLIVTFLYKNPGGISNSIIDLKDELSGHVTDYATNHSATITKNISDSIDITVYDYVAISARDGTVGGCTETPSNCP